MRTRLRNQAFFSRLNPLVFPLFYLKHQGKDHAIVPADRHTRFMVRVNTSDILLIWEIWKFGVYRSTGRQPKIRPDDTVLDIGAHIGVFAVWAAQQAFAGRVLAYEASRSNFTLLMENKALNQITNLHPENQAVYDQAGEFAFFQPDGNGALGSLIQEASAFCETVTTVTLEEVVDKHQLARIDYLKLDAEGAEYPILLNTPRATLQRIRYMVLEYHEFTGEPWRRTDLAAHLRSQGFQVSVEGGIPGQTLLFGTGVIKAWR